MSKVWILVWYSISYIQVGIYSLNIVTRVGINIVRQLSTSDGAITVNIENIEKYP